MTTRRHSSRPFRYYCRRCRAARLRRIAAHGHAGDNTAGRRIKATPRQMPPHGYSAQYARARGHHARQREAALMPVVLSRSMRRRAEEHTCSTNTSIRKGIRATMFSILYSFMPTLFLRYRSLPHHRPIFTPDFTKFTVYPFHFYYDWSPQVARGFDFTQYAIQEGFCVRFSPYYSWRTDTIAPRL